MNQSNRTFARFYREVFLLEHRHPINVALHVAATIASALFVIVLLTLGWYWLALLYPIVHAVPGLIGHRLFERSAAVGDVRVTRTDYSLLWFIVGNHLLTWQVLARRLPSSGAST